MVLLIILNTFLLSFVVKEKSSRHFDLSLAQSAYPELSEIKSQQLTFDQTSNFFTELADKKGAVYAYGALKVAPLPPNTDFHLLGHVVGDKLYKQFGAEGIKVCTEDFRNACSHAIVVGLFSDKGSAALQEIALACQDAPGGSGAYTMCFHGLGHGILAYYGYQFPPAVADCRKTGTAARNNREFTECVGGTVMEIISGGGHDPVAWEKQNKLYLSNANPASFCQNEFIPAEARPICYIYLTPQLFKAAGASLAAPKDEHFVKAFTYCDKLAKDDRVNRDACFGGFGKEFVVLAKERDIRRIDQMTEAELGKVRGWCQLTPDKDGQAACMVYALNSLYWGGENDPQTAINFCELTKDVYLKGVCFDNLVGAVQFYMSDRNYRSDFCQKLPPDVRIGCQKKLLTNQGVKLA